MMMVVMMVVVVYSMMVNSRINSRWRFRYRVVDGAVSHLAIKEEGTVWSKLLFFSRKYQKLMY